MSTPSAFDPVRRAHGAAAAQVVEALREPGLDDVLVFAGGIIPDEDIPALKAAGIAGIFGPGTPIADIVAFHPASTPRRRSI